MPTARFDYKYMIAGQAQAEILFNETLNKLATTLCGSVLSAVTDAQPVSPAIGDAYIVPSSATGTDWTGQDGKIAYYYGGWKFVPPDLGLTMWVEDEGGLVQYDGVNWVGYDPRGLLGYYRQVGSGQDRYYIAGAGGSGVALGTATPSLSTLYALPFICQRRGKIDRLAINVTTLGASGKARIGIYTTANDIDLYPTALMSGSDVAELDTSTTGVKSNTPSPDLVLAAGRLYWFAVNFGTAAPVVRALAATGVLPFLGLDSAFGTALGAGWTVASTYGAMPGAFPGAGTALAASGVLPAIGARFSG